MNRKGSRIAQEIDREYKSQLRNKERFRKLCKKKNCKSCNYKLICEAAGEIE